MGAALACVLLAACDVAVGSEQVNPSAPTVREGRDARADHQQGATRHRKNQGGPDRKKRRAAPVLQPTRDPAPHRRTYLVVRIVDGDTLELGNGETVRLAGIDTPEVGECGYDAASVALARLVAGQRVASRQVRRGP